MFQFGNIDIEEKTKSLRFNLRYSQEIKEYEVIENKEETKGE